MTGMVEPPFVEDARMTHHAGPTLWSELPTPAKEALLTLAPDWLIQALMHAQCGTRCWIPKAGQLPYGERRLQARLRYRALRADGYGYRKTIRTLAAELQCNPRTVQRWLVGLSDTPDKGAD